MKKIDIAKYSIFFICFMFFIIMIMCLSEKSLVHLGDGYEQYYSVYLYIGQWIRNFLSTGKLELYDFSIGYGEDIIGTLNYYGLGDPINVLSCFVRGKHAYYMFAFGIFIRLYLAGLGMLLYLDHKGLRGNIAVASSFIYAFSVFSMVLGLWFYPFLNALYLFPYLLLTLEKIVEDDNRIKYRILFSLFVGIQACCGFYFLYMQVCLLAIFAVIHYFEIHRGKPIIMNVIKKVGELCLFGGLGVLLAGFFLFPSLAAFFQSSRTTGDNNSLRFLFSAGEMVGMLREMVIPNTDAEKNSLGIPAIGLLAICLALSKKYKKTELRWITIAFGIMCFCPLAWSAMNGMSYESNRWLYAIYFVVAYIVCKIFTEIGDRADKCVISFALLAGSSIVLHYIEYGAKIRSFVYFLLVIGIVLMAVKNIRSSLIWTWVIIGCVGINVAFMFSSWKISGFNLPDMFVNFQKVQQMSAFEHEHQGEWFRDTTQEESYEAMLKQKRGTAEYLSMLNGNIFDFYSELYLSTGIHGSRHDLRTPDNRKNVLTLLNIRQYMNDNIIVKNELFKSQGLLYTRAMSEDDFMKLSPVERQTAIMKYIILEDDNSDDLLEIQEEKGLSFDVLSQHERNNNNRIINMSAEEKIELKLCSPIENEGIYVLISNFVCYQNDFEVIDVNGEELLIVNPESKYDTGVYDCLIYIPAGKCKKIEITFKAAGKYSWENIQIYESDDEYIVEANEELTKHIADTYLHNDTYLSTRIETVTPGYYFYSIPYSNNWKAYVDGNEIEVLKANIGFMAVEIPEGEHLIELRYCPMWEYVGGGCTIFAIIVLIWLVIAEKKRNIGKWGRREYENQ